MAFEIIIMIICRESSIHSSLSVNSDLRFTTGIEQSINQLYFCIASILKPNFLLVQCFLLWSLVLPLTKLDELGFLEWNSNTLLKCKQRSFIKTPIIKANWHGYTEQLALKNRKINRMLGQEWADCSQCKTPSYSFNSYKQMNIPLILNL